MLSASHRKSHENTPPSSEKEGERVLQLQEEELHCQKQIQQLYGRLSQVFERGVALETRRNALNTGKIHLNSLANADERDLAKDLLALRQAYKSAETEYSSLKKSVITTSLKIKQASKEASELKDLIAAREATYASIKRQTEQLKEREVNSTAEMAELQAKVKAQALRKISLLRMLPQPQPQDDSKRQQLLRKISEMKAINDTLSELLHA